MATLQTPVSDAESVDRVLRTKYGFKTRLLRNATRGDIMAALNDYRTHLTVHDNLLIYYAGHGERDQSNGRGYWLPVDAKRGDNTQWISDQQITDQIDLMQMTARHVLIVADSCYSGVTTRDAGMQRIVAKEGSDDAAAKRLAQLVHLPSRTVLTSGGDEPVLDNGAQGNSIFARAFVDFLTHNDRIVETWGVWNGIFDSVKRSAARLNRDQSPHYEVLAHAGHANGEFLFVPRS
jgi:hypothetical protein